MANVEVADPHAPSVATDVMDPGVSHRPSVLGALLRPIEAISAALLVGLIGLVLASVFFRYVLGSPITAADEIASFMFLWIVMFGAVIAIDRNEHLRLALLLNSVPPRTRRLLEAVGLVDHGDLPRRPPALRDRAHVLRDGRRLARARHLHGVAGCGHPARDDPDARRARRESCGARRAARTS